MLLFRKNMCLRLLLQQLEINLIIKEYPFHSIVGYSLSFNDNEVDTRPVNDHMSRRTSNASEYGWPLYQSYQGNGRIQKLIVSIWLEDAIEQDWANKR